MIKKALLFTTVLMLCCSCGTIVDEILRPDFEYELNKGWESAKAKSTRSPDQSAKLTKEQEQLKKEGKCPVCRGMGKTIDGKYDCSACNGTGKYKE